LRRLLLGPLLAGAALLAPLAIGTATAATPATATYSTDSDWETGFQGKFTIKAGSSTLQSWTLEFDVPPGTTISSAWDARMTRNGNHYTFTNPTWYEPLAPGASTTFGFIGAPGGGFTPLNCTLNGQPCSGEPGSPGPSPTSSPSPTVSPSPSPPVSPSPSPTVTTSPNPGGDKKIVGYFTEWGVYGRQYFVKNLVTSGTASKIDYINYAFGNVTNGQCAIGDSYAAYDMAYTAENSVDGKADTWDTGALRGNFNQLRKLKAMYPHIKVIWSFGGWTWSSGFAEAARNPEAFAESCYRLLKDPRWADVFDGIDIDWEYPNACGLSCDTSGPDAFRRLMAALRAKFGPDFLVTAAISGDGTSGGKLDAADYAGAAQYVDWYLVMTYDYFGAWAATGPTAPHSPLTSYSGIPTAGFYADAAIQKLKSKGIPANKLLLGIGFYGRGWTGVTQSAPGGTATGPAPGTYEQGVEDYKVLKTSCPATGTIAGTAYAHCGDNWWSYDTPATIAGKMDYVKNQGLGGAFIWEFSGDTANGELAAAVAGNLR